MLVDWRPIPAAILLFAAATVYARIGDVAARRQTEDGRLAGFLFRTWWIAFAIAAETQGFANTLAAFGVRSVPVWIALALVSAFMVCLGFWGVTFAIVYALTGRRPLWWLTAFYALVHALLVALLFLGRPIDVAVGEWGSVLVFDTPVLSLALPAMALLTAPPLVAGLACLRAARRLDAGFARARLQAVGTSVVIIAFAVAFACIMPSIASLAAVGILAAAASAGVLVVTYARVVPDSGVAA